LADGSRAGLGARVAAGFRRSLRLRCAGLFPDAARPALVDQVPIAVARAALRRGASFGSSVGSADVLPAQVLPGRRRPRHAADGAGFDHLMAQLAERGLGGGGRGHGWTPTGARCFRSRCRPHRAHCVQGAITSFYGTDRRASASGIEPTAARPLHGRGLRSGANGGVTLFDLCQVHCCGRHRHRRGRRNRTSAVFVQSASLGCPHRQANNCSHRR
jgi:hypothetical protein